MNIKNIIHVPKPATTISTQLQTHLFLCREKKIFEKYLSILIPFTFSHLTSLIWLPSPLLQQNCLSQGFFVNLLISFSEPFSVLILSSQSILTTSFPWHVIHDVLICFPGRSILIPCTSTIHLILRTSKPYYQSPLVFPIKYDLALMGL